jgi:hypothetical protein
MGLGGITRDSIADLASLVHDDDDDDKIHHGQFRASSYAPEYSVDAPVTSGDDTTVMVVGEENEAVLNDDGSAAASVAG